jgi:hypothetical protein
MKRITLIALSCALTACITVQAPPQPAQPQIVYLPAPAYSGSAPAQEAQQTPEDREKAMFFLSLCSLAFDVAKNESEKTGQLERASWMHKRSDWYANQCVGMEPSEGEMRTAVTRAQKYLESDAADFNQLGASCRKFYDENGGSLDE